MADPALKRLGYSHGVATRRALQRLLLNGHVLDEAPVTAGINLDIAYVLLSDDDVCLVPEWENRHVARHDILDARIQHLRFFSIKSIHGFVDQGINWLPPTHCP